MMAQATGRPEIGAILARMDRAGALSREDQATLADALDIGVSRLPPQIRGGLVGIFFGDNRDTSDG